MKNWKPANDFIVLKAVLRKELKESKIIRDYEHKDYHFIVELVNDKAYEKMIGKEVLLPYPYLNNISENSGDPKADKVYYVNKLDIRLYRDFIEE